MKFWPQKVQYLNVFISLKIIFHDNILSMKVNARSVVFIIFIYNEKMQISARRR